MGNPNTCLKVSPRQIQKIVFRAAEMQDRAPEFLDLLGMIVKVTGTDLTLKRNQAYVMKYIMQNYKKVAYVLDLPLEEKFVYTMHANFFFFFAREKKIRAKFRGTRSSLSFLAPIQSCTAAFILGQFAKTICYEILVHKNREIKMSRIESG